MEASTAVSSWRMPLPRLLFVAFIAVVFACFPFITGCAANAASADTAQNGKTVVRVSMYNSSSFPAWREYVEKQCPDVFIQWEDNRNACSNVVYQAEHGDMPDIVAIRRYESDSARALEPYLADMSGLSLTSTFKEEYLAPYADNGKQCWLPEPGTFEGIWANGTLFDRYGIALPTDQESFIGVCRQFEAVGVTPFASDLSQGFSCVALLEGFGSTSYLSTDEGLAWREAFDEGRTDTVDAQGFSQIFDLIRTLEDAGVLTPDLLTLSSDGLNDLMSRGQVAMVKRSSDERTAASSAYSLVALPYFGETSDRNMLFSYPVFSLALSAAAAGDSTRGAAAGEVLEAMMSADAQNLLNTGGDGLISYNKEIELPVKSSMEQIEPLIKANRCYVRSLNSNTFSASKTAMKAIIADGADDASVLATLNAGLFKQASSEVVGTSNLQVSNARDENLCSPSASVLAQVVRSRLSTDFALIDSREATAPLYRGPYTAADISALAMADDVYVAKLTGAQIKQLMRDGLRYTTTFTQGAIEPLIDYPALAGFTAAMEKDGTLLSLTDERGAELSDSATYSLALSSRVYTAMTAKGNVLANAFKKQDKGLVTCLNETFAADAGLPEAVEYYDVY